MISDQLAVASRLLGEIAEVDVPLAPMTTYRVGGNAAVLARVRRREDLATVAHAVQRSELPVLAVGKGSNLLIADSGFSGIAVTLADIADWVEIDVERERASAGSAMFLPVLARRTAAAGLRGFEWAVGVPGSLGGAIRMNAGGHGSDMSECLISATVADLSTDGVPRRRDVDELGLAFRSSRLRAEELVLDGTLQLAVGDAATSRAEISEIVEWRRENQPGGQNAGSVFVNPVPGEVSAGALIDELGLRGLRHGTAEVSTKHANFIQADEGGSADDVRALMEIVRERVERDTGFLLRSEIRLVGFEERP